MNVDKVTTLTATGRMREPGLAQVRGAQEDGRWAQAYESQKTAAVPPDLTARLDGNPEARAAFDALDRTRRYRIVLPLLQARTPGVRQARLDRAMEALLNSGAAE